MLHRITTLARKDIRLLMGDKEALFWIFLFPLMFSLFFGYMFSSPQRGGGRIDLAVVDEDATEGSRAFVGRLAESDSLNLRQTTAEGAPMTRDAAQNAVRRGDLTGFLVIPAGYGAKAEEFWRDAPPLQLGIDPARKAEEGMLEGILMEQIFSGLQEQFTDPQKARDSAQKALAELESDKEMPLAFKASLRTFLSSMDSFMQSVESSDLEGSPLSREGLLEKVAVTEERGERPKSAFEITFPSAIIWGMFGCIVTFAISIVQERTKGTLIRLRMSPLSKLEILAGKGLACLVVCLFVATLLQLLGRFIFGVRIGSIPALAVALVCVAVCFTGLMMALATVGRTERAVSGAASGIFMPLAMIGGAMVPLFLMPQWLRQLSNVSPVKWAILSLEGAIWRNFSWSEMAIPCGVLLAIGVGCFLLGVRLLARQEI